MGSDYTPQTWHDSPETDTPISADRLTVIEEGIRDHEHDGSVLPDPATGDAGKVVTVNDAEDGYELGTPAGGASADPGSNMSATIVSFNDPDFADYAIYSNPNVVGDDFVIATGSSPMHIEIVTAGLYTGMLAVSLYNGDLTSVGSYRVALNGMAGIPSGWSQFEYHLPVPRGLPSPNYVTDQVVVLPTVWLDDSQHLLSFLGDYEGAGTPLAVYNATISLWRLL